MNIALISAGGVGARMGQEIPKQFLSVDDRPVIAYTLQAFQDHPEIDSIAVVCVAGWEDVLRAYARQFGITKLDLVVTGGETGQESIRRGLYALEEVHGADDIVLVHDSIRPMVSAEIISECIAVTERHGDATAVIPCAEAMLTTADGQGSDGQYPRDGLKRTQTPQGFRLGYICSLQRRAAELGINNTVACCTLMVELGETVHFSRGSERNVKLTTVDDVEIFRALLAAERPAWLK